MKHKMMSYGGMKKKKKPMGKKTMNKKKMKKK